MTYKIGDKVRFEGGQWTVLKVRENGVYSIRGRGYGRWAQVTADQIIPWVTQKKEVLDAATCQICERTIGSKKGLIAHHGYTRPQHLGFQTSSCWGARHLPYEKDREILGQYIKAIERHIESTKENLVTWQTTDPTIEENIGTFRKPQYRTTTPDDPYYPWKKKSVIAGIERQLKHLEEDLAHQTKRWNDWKAPE